jgi:type II restriction enzyme
MFILPDMVIARNPLSASAVRGPWVGCNIDIRRVPASGRISLITDGKPVSPKAVMNSWHRITFLDERQSLPQRGWTIDVMREVDALRQQEFNLDDLYAAATARLQALHPSNSHVHEKIRQQLQVLRDAGHLNFVGRGRYQKQ